MHSTCHSAPKDTLTPTLARITGERPDVFRARLAAPCAPSLLGKMTDPSTNGNALSDDFARELFDKNKERLIAGLPTLSRIGSRYLDTEWPPWILRAIRDVNVFYAMCGAAIDPPTVENAWKMILSMSKSVYVYTDSERSVLQKEDITSVDEVYRQYETEDHAFAVSLNAFDWNRESLGVSVPVITLSVYDLVADQFVCFALSHLSGGECLHPVELPCSILARAWLWLNQDPARSYMMTPFLHAPIDVECAELYALVTYALTSPKVNSGVTPPLRSVADFFVFGSPLAACKQSLDLRVWTKTRTKLQVSFRTNLLGRIANFRCDNSHGQRDEVHYDIEHDRKQKCLSFAITDAGEFAGSEIIRDVFGRLLLLGTDVPQLNLVGKDEVLATYGEIISLRRWQVKQMVDAIKQGDNDAARDLAASEGFMVGFPHGEGRCVYENLRSRENNQLIAQYNLELNTRLATTPDDQKPGIYRDVLSRERQLADILDGFSPSDAAAIQTAMKVIKQHFEGNIQWLQSLDR